jgi:hypothetical protein
MGCKFSATWGGIRKRTRTRRGWGHADAVEDDAGNRGEANEEATGPADVANNNGCSAVSRAGCATPAQWRAGGAGVGPSGLWAHMLARAIVWRNAQVHSLVAQPGPRLAVRSSHGLSQVRGRLRNFQRPSVRLHVWGSCRLERLYLDAAQRHKASMVQISAHTRTAVDNWG